MFVRLFVDENLDRMVPISKQPKEKIQAIIDSCRRQFPEYQERARKRIRTYLKSCRRMKRSGFEMVSFELKHSPRFHPNPTCKPWHDFFFHLSVFLIFSITSGPRGFCLLVCFCSFSSSWSIYPLCWFNKEYFVSSAHRPAWYHVLEKEGHMSEHRQESASHSCVFPSCYCWSRSKVNQVLNWSTNGCFRWHMRMVFSETQGNEWIHLSSTVFISTIYK